MNIGYLIQKAYLIIHLILEKFLELAYSPVWTVYEIINGTIDIIKIRVDSQGEETETEPEPQPSVQTFPSTNEGREGTEYMPIGFRRNVNQK